MITVEQALEHILGAVSVLEKEEKPLLECLGQVLAEDVLSPLDVPPADNSAMDGFAVVAASVRGASPSAPRTLKVVGEVAAGRVRRRRVAPGTAVRIMTGAPIPPGADGVVPFEDTDEEERRQARDISLSHIGIRQEVAPGANIRRAGEDIKRGSLVISRGTELQPPHLGLLASLGMQQAPVIRRPMVAILSTGDELVPQGRRLPPGKIYNSNSYTVAAEVARLGAVPLMLGIARDQTGDILKKIRAGLRADLLLTSGGVSRGDYDIVKKVLAAEGEMTFWAVRMKPGKPLAFGTFRQDGRVIPHLGLPGNPVSTLVTFELFARPAILKMMGKEPHHLPAVTAMMEEAVRNSDGRRYYARVCLSQREGKYFARITGEQGSGILTSMAQADGLAVIPEDTAGVKAGDRVRVLLLDWRR